MKNTRNLGPGLKPLNKFETIKHLLIYSSLYTCLKNTQFSDPRIRYLFIETDRVQIRASGLTRGNRFPIARCLLKSRPSDSF